MKTNPSNIIVIVLTAGFVSACGASSTASKPSNSSVVEQKAARAGSTAERRVDQHTDHQINNAIDNLFKKL